MNKRIKELRKTLGLTQLEFANKIGVKRNTVATYEMGRSVPSDSALSLICKTFDVNEIWLRTGQGDIFNPVPETSVDELVKEYGLDELDRRIILGYLRLSESDRVEVRRYVQGLLDVVTGSGKLQAEDIDKNIDSDGGGF